MTQVSINLPYFDVLLTELDEGNTEAQQAFGRHVHWGYWENPKSANGTLENFAQATEQLSQIICRAAGIEAGMRVLDVGCGFGGTIASLNERFSPIELVGLNIDERQLQLARQNVLALNGNQIEFVCGNACELPFADNSFDAVVAVECIFHFPDRNDFFQEAARVLRPGGRLALSDFVLSQKAPPFFDVFSKLGENITSLFYGKTNICQMEDYIHLAKNAGLKTFFERDITEETMPTFDILFNLIKKSDKSTFIPYWTTRLVEFAQRYKIIQYKVLAYEKP